MWQDYAIALVVLVFTLTTIPMLRQRLVLPLWTTVPMVLGTALLIICYATLELTYSTLVEIVACGLWCGLLYVGLENYDRR